MAAPIRFAAPVMSATGPEFVIIKATLYSKSSYVYMLFLHMLSAI